MSITLPPLLSQQELNLILKDTSNNDIVWLDGGLAKDNEAYLRSNAITSTTVSRLLRELEIGQPEFKAAGGDVDDADVKIGADVAHIFAGREDIVLASFKGIVRGIITSFLYHGMCVVIKAADTNTPHAISPHNLRIGYVGIDIESGRMERTWALCYASKAGRGAENPVVVDNGILFLMHEPSTNLYISPLTNVIPEIRRTQHLLDSHNAITLVGALPPTIAIPPKDERADEVANRNLDEDGDGRAARALLAMQQRFELTDSIIRPQAARLDRLGKMTGVDSEMLRGMYTNSVITVIPGSTVHGSRGVVPLPTKEELHVEQTLLIATAIGLPAAKLRGTDRITLLGAAELLEEEWLNGIKTYAMFCSIVMEKVTRYMFTRDVLIATCSDSTQFFEVEHEDEVSSTSMVDRAEIDRILGPTTITVLYNVTIPNSVVMRLYDRGMLKYAYVVRQVARNTGIPITEFGPEPVEVTGSGSATNPKKRKRDPDSKREMPSNDLSSAKYDKISNSGPGAGGPIE